MNSNFKCISGNSIKWIAIITMAVDHVGALLFPQYQIFRWIGRIAFPLFCFLLVEGFLHTSNTKKYIGRLFLFALISEIPFDLALRGKMIAWDYQNVFWTLLLGLLALYLITHLPNYWQGLLAGLALMAVAQLAHTDYGACGVLLIFLLYRFREQHGVKFLTMAILFYFGYGVQELFGLVAFLPMLLYNGQRGKYSTKYFFYVFYPAHLLLLCLLQHMLLGI